MVWVDIGLEEFQLVPRQPIFFADWQLKIFQHINPIFRTSR